MGSKPFFRFRSGTHGSNAELGRQNIRNSSHFDHWFSKTKAFLCSIWNLCKEKPYSLGSSSDLVSYNSVKRCMVNGSVSTHWNSFTFHHVLSGLESCTP